MKAQATRPVPGGVPAGWLNGVLIAAVTYVVAWAIGLLVAPRSPDGTATAEAVHDFYAAHAGAARGQSLLVHGLAGLALAVLAVGLPHVVGAGGALARAVNGFGLAAAAVSWAQAGLGVVITRDVPGTGADTSRALFQAINLADSLKLMLLGGFVAAATVLMRRCGPAPAWLCALGYVLAPLLALAGAAFVVDGGVLDAALVVSLLLLLAWVAAVAVVLAWAQLPDARRFPGARAV